MRAKTGLSEMGDKAMASQPSRHLTFRMAAALLRHEGSLSLSDIAALPGVESNDEAQAIFRALLRSFDAEQATESDLDRTRMSQPVIRLRPAGRDLETVAESRRMRSGSTGAACRS